MLLLRSLVFILLFSCAWGQNNLLIYTTDSFAEGVGASLKKEFESRHKVKIIYITTNGASSTYLDLLNTKRDADGFIGLSYDMTGTKQIQKVLSPHSFAMNTFSLPFSWNEKQLIPIFYSALGFVAQGDIPTSVHSFEDLLTLNKKIILIDPRTSHPGFGLLLWVKSVYGDRSQQFWKTLKPKILTIAKSWSAAYSLFMQGESPIVLSYVTSPAYHRLKEKNASIQLVRFQEGHFLQIYTAGVLERSKKKSLMKDFLRLALSPSFQKKIVYEDWSYPVVDIQEPLPEEFQKKDDFHLPFSPETIESNKKEWITEWLNALS